MRIRCLEPERRPVLATLEVDPGQVFRVCLLPPEPDGPQLRHTILRLRESPLPPRTQPLLELAVVEGAARESVLRVLAVDPEHPLEAVQGELRTRVLAGSSLRPTVSFELRGDLDLSQVRFTLELEQQLARGARAAVAGSGTARSQALSSGTGLLWVIPSAWSVLADKPAWVVSQVRIVGTRLGLSPRTTAMLIAGFCFVMLNLGVLWTQVDKANAAEAEANAANDARARAEAAAEAALMSELTCLAEREELAARFEDMAETRALRAEQALATSASRAVALELGGQALGSPEVLAFDQQLLADLSTQVQADMSALREAPAEAARCLSQASLLGSGLPRYALLWHPDPSLSCPAGYTAVLDGQELAGRWGLSTRLARQLGAPAPGDRARLAAERIGVDAPDVTEVLEDRRMEDRWAAQTLSAALRMVQQRLLASRPEGRIPVAPAQAQLWSLAVLSTLNDLPSPAGGALDAPMETCVDELLDQVAAQAPPAAPGQPVLPDLVAVALGETEVVLSPTPGCPWARDTLRDGTQGALLAVARLALHEPGVD